VRLLLGLACGAACFAATVPFDSSGYTAGPVVMTSTAEEIAVTLAR
jgi:hypothetical protein